MDRKLTTVGLAFPPTRAVWRRRLAPARTRRQDARATPAETAALLTLNPESRLLIFEVPGGSLETVGRLLKNPLQRACRIVAITEVVVEG